MPEEQVSNDSGEQESSTDASNLSVPSVAEAGKLPPGVDQELIQALVKEGIDAALSPIKENLNNAYSARDEAVAQMKKYEQEKQDAEIQRLKDEGSHKEAYEKEMLQMKTREEELVKLNTELTRDVELRSVLNPIDFRNEKAADMAFREIKKDLVKNDQGEWVHKSGVNLKEYTATYIKSEDNAFLLKQKPNTGTGSPTTTTTAVDDSDGKSLFKMSQAEVLKRAQEGKLPTQQ